MGRSSARRVRVSLLVFLVLAGGLSAGCSRAGETATVVRPTPTEAVPLSPTSVPTASRTPAPTVNPRPSSTPSPKPSPPTSSATRSEASTATPTPLIKELTQAYLKDMGWETQTWDFIGTLLLKSINGVEKNINIDPKTKLGWTQEFQYSPKTPWPAGTKTPQTFPNDTAMWLWNGQSFQAFNIKGERVLDSQGNYLYFDNGSLTWLKPTPVPPTPTARPEVPPVCSGLPDNYGKYNIGNNRIIGLSKPEDVFPFDRVYYGGSLVTIGQGMVLSIDQSNKIYTIDLGVGVFTFSYDPNTTYFAIFNINEEDPQKRNIKTDLCNVLIPGTKARVYVKELKNGAFTTGAWQ